MDIKSIKRVENINNSHGIIVVMDHEKASRRFNAMLNRTTSDWAAADIDGVTYVGESYEGLIVVETTGRFELILVEDGVRIQLRRHLLEDDQVLDMEVEWTEMIPLVRWFMQIEGEDLMSEEDKFFAHVEAEGERMSRAA